MLLCIILVFALFFIGYLFSVIDKQAEAIANAQKPAPFYEWMKHVINERA